MTAIVLSVLGLAVVFAGFGILTVGSETGRCGLCAGGYPNNNSTSSECSADLSGENKKCVKAHALPRDTTSDNVRLG